MDVTLPSGVVIRGVPEGTTKDQIRDKAISSGLATASDFGVTTAADVPIATGIFAAPSPAQNTQDPSMLDKGIAGAKAFGVMAGNAIPATVGALGGSIYGIGAELAGAPSGSGQQYQAKGAEKLSPFSTSDPLANQYIQNAGEALGQLDPGFIGAALRGSTVASQAVRDSAPAARQVATDFGRAVNEAPQAIKNTLSKTDDSARSMGAAEVGNATRRREMAAQLPVDPKLTEGQATRNFDQQRFENEAMKSELGQPLRERAAAQHQAIRQSFDDFIDQTGAQAPDIRATGIAIDKALSDRARRDKTEIRLAYNQANKSEEARTPIDPNRSVSIGEGDNAIEGSVIDYINSKPAGLRATGLIDDAKNYAVKLGIATRADDGSLIARPATLRAMEDWRREIGGATGSEPTDIREATILKKIIDAQTEDAVGPVYKRARALRSKYADQYENRAVVSDLLNNKRGTADRRVALEDVADRILFRGSLDDAKHVRKVLQNSGEDGQQAWRELQGAGLKYIRDEATKNVARDVNGQEMISPAGLHKAINRLDSDGKLDALYGKNGAEKIRAINELSKDLFTSPPGAINHSNTASVLLAALDMAVSGTAGLPLPIASGVRLAVKNIKDRKMKARIQAALGNTEGKK